MTVGTSPVGSDDELAERYGRSAPRRRPKRRWLAIAGVVIGVLFVALLWWSGPSSPGSQLEAQEAGYEVIDDRTVAVRWRLTVEPGRDVRCAVQALNARYGVVGWKIVDVPPSDRRTRLLSEQLQTTEPAETGLIYRCWLA